MKLKKQSVCILLIILSFLFISCSSADLLITQKQDSDKKKVLTFDDACRIVNDNWKTSTAVDGEMPEFLVHIDSIAEFEILSMTTKDDSLLLQAKVSAPDVGASLSQIDLFSLDPNSVDIDALLKNAVVNSSIKTEVYEIEIIYENDEYKVLYSEEFVDAMHGWIISYSQNALNDYYKSILQTG